MTKLKRWLSLPLVAAFGMLSACGGRAYDRAFAGSTRIPIEPPSAELSARFCLEAARTYYREAQVDRALGNTGLIVGGLAVGVAGTLWLQEDHGDASESKQSTMERASEVGLAIGLTGLVVGGVAHLAACRNQSEANARVDAGLELVRLAERLEQIEVDLQKCRDGLEGVEETTEVRADTNENCEELKPKGSAQAPCFVFELERCNLKHGLTKAVGPCVGRAIDNENDTSPISSNEATESSAPSPESSAEPGDTSTDSSVPQSSASDATPSPDTAPSAPQTEP